MQDRVEQAIALLGSFAERTGVTTARAPQRYLWTDAFAVCTYLGLAKATGNREFRDTALRLIDHVHRTLGRHRPDDTRQGWLSGLDDEQAAAHPTLGGLRIGKPLPERGAYDVADDALEWVSDGQYFHYLTKWMHALDQTARATGRSAFNVWARELAARAFDAFTYTLDGSDERRIHWKMSIDLSRPLVRTMGQHDPLDGYVTYVQLEATARAAPEPERNPHVDALADELASAIERSSLHTTDPLGLGGLLFDAARIDQLAHEHAFRDEGLAAIVIAAAGEGLATYERQRQLTWPPERRLPFRELGLALGLRGLELIADAATGDRLRDGVERLRRYLPLADEIEAFWRVERHRQVQTWTEHRDINDVMFAATLCPEGFLVLDAPAEAVLHGPAAAGTRPGEALAEPRESRRTRG